MTAIWKVVYLALLLATAALFVGAFADISSLVSVGGTVLVAACIAVAVRLLTKPPSVAQLITLGDDPDDGPSGMSENEAKLTLGDKGDLRSQK